MVNNNNNGLFSTVHICASPRRSRFRNNERALPHASQVTHLQIKKKKLNKELVAFLNLATTWKPKCPALPAKDEVKK